MISFVWISPCSVFGFFLGSVGCWIVLKLGDTEVLSGSRADMAAPTDEQRRNFLQANVDADLIFVWDEAGVPLSVQYGVGQNYRSVRKFSALGDSRAEVRAAFVADFALDPAANPAVRPTLASLVTAWQVASEVVDKEIQARAEAKNLGAPRQVTYTDRNALVSSYERVYGRLEDRDTPSSDYLSLKVEAKKRL